MDETGSGRSNEAFDDRNELDPGDAALLVEQTARQAQRAFDLVSPVAAAVGAGVFLVGYGAVWWSIRGEATYTGSPGWAIGVLYGAIGVAAIVGGTVARRATAGVRGRSARRQGAQAGSPPRSCTACTGRRSRSSPWPPRGRASLRRGNAGPSCGSRWRSLLSRR